MKIYKILNNNVVTILNNNDKESVVMGRGIAVQKKKGDEIDDTKVEKIFVLENNNVNDKFLKLINDIPVECIEVAEEIISYAEENLETTLNENIYLTLTDHISFTANRYKNNMEMKNSMLWDIKRLHRQEFNIGLKALSIIKDKLDLNLPEDEAATIAMHILNGELNQDMPEIVNMIKVTEEILKIVKYHFNIEFDEESINYYRFLTHLKFFTQRLFNGNYYEDYDNELFDMMSIKYPESYECVKKIKKFIYDTYGNNLTKEEMLYLIVHISRVISSK